MRNFLPKAEKQKKACRQLTRDIYAALHVILPKN
jgi:hypothetical protein